MEVEKAQETALTEEDKSLNTEEKEALGAEFLTKCDIKDILRGLFSFLQSSNKSYTDITEGERNTFVQLLTQDVRELRLDFANLKEEPQTKENDDDDDNDDNLEEETENNEGENQEGGPKSEKKPPVNEEEDLARLAGAFKYFTEVRSFAFDIHNKPITDEKLGAVLDGASALTLIEHFEFCVSFKEELTRKSVENLTDFLWDNLTGLKSLKLELDGLEKITYKDRDVWLMLADALTNFPELKILKLSLTQNNFDSSTILYFLNIIKGLRELSILELNFQFGMKKTGEFEGENLETIKENLKNAYKNDISNHFSLIYPRAVYVKIITDLDETQSDEVARMNTDNQKYLLECFDFFKAIQEECKDERDILKAENLVLDCSALVFQDMI